MFYLKKSHLKPCINDKVILKIHNGSHEIISYKENDLEIHLHFSNKKRRLGTCFQESKHT